MELGKARKISEQINDIDLMKSVKKLTDEGVYSITLNSEDHTFTIKQKDSKLLGSIINSFARKQIELKETHIKNNY